MLETKENRYGSPLVTFFRIFKLEG
jgi:hypothetical protein